MNRCNSAHHTKPKLLEQVKRAMRTRNYRPRTIATYVQWIKRSILFHTPKTPSIEREGGPDTCVGRRVSAESQFTPPQAGRTRRTTNPFRFLIFPPHEKARNIPQQAVIARAKPVEISFCTVTHSARQ